VLERIQRGEIQVTATESILPSPVAQSLLWDFISVFMYEWDAPKAERQLQTMAVSRELLQDLLKDVDLAGLLRPEAVSEGARAASAHRARALARTVEELALLFQTLGDLATVEIAARCTVDPANWIGRLAGSERIVLLTIPTAHGPAQRWVAAEYAAEYRAAFVERDASRSPTNLRSEITSRSTTKKIRVHPPNPRHPRSIPPPPHADRS
jgi:ATP-dependent Lhr-like helicase